MIKKIIIKDKINKEKPKELNYLIKINIYNHVC